MRAPAEDYRPLTRRRRLLVVALAVATAVAVVATLLDPPGGVQRKRPAASAPADCAPGKTDACVGGKAEVLAPQRAASR
ncbi:MAG: hypothetical protein HZC37_11425 [Burkholderiales bacterium]|nr:hypothetical protein [Burkholderiales bacterium]